MEHIELDFRADALTAVAKRRLKERPARGLRSILENVLFETMYDAPSLEGVTKVVVDEAVIKGDSEPDDL